MARVELYREGPTLTAFPDAPYWRDVYGKWRWRFISNGYEMGGSKHGYSRRIDCLNGAATVLGGVAVGTSGIICFTTSIGEAEVIATYRLVPVTKAPRR